MNKLIYSSFSFTQIQFVLICILLLCQNSFASDCDSNDETQKLIEKGSNFYDTAEFEESINCFTISAERGDGYSNGVLGWIYENGIGVSQNYEKALKFRIIGANSGDAYSQGGLAWHYKTGTEVEQDDKLAVKYFELSAEQGDSYGQYGLAWYYENGVVVSQNYDEAFRLSLLSAEQNYSSAMQNLGFYYANGYGVEQDYEKAVKWYLKGAKNGDVNSMGDLGFHYASGLGVEQDYEKAFSWRLKGARLGDAYAQGGLAWQYEKGVGVEKNIGEALRWRQLGAEQDDAYSQGGLAWHYLAGEGVDQDYEEAERLLNIASENGDAYSQASLGWMYENGFTRSGVNYDEAFRLRQLAAEQDNDDAQAGLGWHYSEGKGVEQDYEEAVYWYKLAADQGDAYGQAGLAWHYAEGLGTDQDNVMAIKYFTSAAEQGNAWAQGNLAWMISEGLGVEQDDEEAFKWFLKGAQGGDVYSQSQTGFNYENGIGTELDRTEAFKWYSRAAQSDDEYAKDHLAGLLENYPELRKQNKNLIEIEYYAEENNTDKATEFSAAITEIDDSETSFDFELIPVEQEAIIISKTFIRTKPNVSSKRLQTAREGSTIYIAAKVDGENYFLVNDLNGVALGYIYGDQISFEKVKDTNENVNIEWGNYYALIIANNNYINPGFQDLDTPLNDANEIEKVLREKYKFKTQLLINASEENILENIYSYREKLRDNDNFLIYYAGHGYLDESNNVGYWQPIDAVQNKSWTWISNQTISDELKAMKAKHILVIADSCYSGTFIYRSTTGEQKPKDNENIKIFYEKKNNKKARLALTSGDYQPVPDSLDGKHSPFAKALITTLAQNNEILLSSELYQMIEKQLALASTYQEPLYGAILNSDHREGADFIFSLE